MRSIQAKLKNDLTIFVVESQQNFSDLKNANAFTLYRFHERSIILVWIHTTELHTLYCLSPNGTWLPLRRGEERYKVVLVHCAQMPYCPILRTVLALDQ
jgi:hypothetical protein